MTSPLTNPLTSPLDNPLTNPLINSYNITPKDITLDNILLSSTSGEILRNQQNHKMGNSYKPFIITLSTKNDSIIIYCFMDYRDIKYIIIFKIDTIGQLSIKFMNNGFLHSLTDEIIQNCKDLAMLTILKNYYIFNFFDQCLDLQIEKMLLANNELFKEHELYRETNKHIRKDDPTNSLYIKYMEICKIFCNKVRIYKIIITLIRNMSDFLKTNRINIFSICKKYHQNTTLVGKLMTQYLTMTKKALLNPTELHTIIFKVPKSEFNTIYLKYCIDIISGAFDTLSKNRPVLEKLIAQIIKFKYDTDNIHSLDQAKIKPQMTLLKRSILNKKYLNIHEFFKAEIEQENTIVAQMMHKTIG